MRYILLLIPIIVLSSCWKVISEQDAIQHCQKRWQELWSIDTPFMNFDQTDLNFNVNCTTKETNYEKCLRIIRDSYSDLSDTWGNNTNNQDSISKTMSAEVDRCLKNISLPK